MVPPTQLCWSYHSLPLRERNAVFYFSRLDYVIHSICTMGKHLPLNCDHATHTLFKWNYLFIISFTIIYSTVYSGVDQRKHQSSATLAFVRGIHRWQMNSPHKSPVTQKMFPILWRHNDITKVCDINLWQSFDTSSILPDIRFLRPPYIYKGNPHSLNVWTMVSCGL